MKERRKEGGSEEEKEDGRKASRQKERKNKRKKERKSRKENIFVNGMADDLIMILPKECAE